MNRYSLASDSRRWWWPSASAGAIGLAAVTTLFVLPVSSVTAAPTSPAGSTSVERPCFIVQPHWNTALDGPQPVCTTPVSALQPAAQMRAPGRTVSRTGLGYLP